MANATTHPSNQADGDRVKVRIVFNEDDGGLYVWHSGAWQLLAQLSS